MKSIILTSILCLVSVAAVAEEGFYQFKHPGIDWSQLIPGTKWKVHDATRPTPPRVIPGNYVEQGVQTAPADAEILFDGSSLDQFENNAWLLKDGYVVAGNSALRSKKAYGDFQMHLEFRSPDPSVVDKTSKMGNSGIYIMGRYELQIFDSYSCKIYADGSAGALYGQTPPLVNASRKPGEWQTFEIYFKAPVFEDEKLVSPARMTVLHNGVFVQIDTELTGPTSHNKPAFYEPHEACLPFFLQGGKCPVEFRNIWIRDLDSKR